MERKRFKNETLNKKDHRVIEIEASLFRIIFFPVYIVLKVIDKLSAGE